MDHDAAVVVPVEVMKDSIPHRFALPRSHSNCRIVNRRRTGTGCIQRSHEITMPLLLLLVVGLLLDDKSVFVNADTEMSNENSDSNSKYHDTEMQQHMNLFQYATDAMVSGPTKFPKPTDYYFSTKSTTTPMEEKVSDHLYDIVPYLQPVAGTHRREEDAVIAFAAEYPLSNYISFIESLRVTGFTGDIILAISPLDMRKEDVWEYLTEPDNHIVLYAPVLTCYNAEQEVVESAKGGARLCICNNIYGQRNKIDNTITPIDDPRTPRTVQTLRYEIYWLMLLPISQQSWILLVDARDTYFQLDPFASVPRQTDPQARSGILYFFGENIDATRLGQSKSNRKWLQAAYGDTVTTVLQDKPTICSGATMGEQLALETYIRAMVGESDTTGTVLAGADQGFHNYLYYSHKFQYTETIHSIIVFDQGQGIVNNMGALRTKELREWGNGNIIQVTTDEAEANPRKKHSYIVLNWDGTPSPVVHQFDRHQQLSDFYFKVKVGQFTSAWEQRKQKLPPAVTE